MQTLKKTIGRCTYFFSIITNHLSHIHILRCADAFSLSHFNELGTNIFPIILCKHWIFEICRERRHWPRKTWSNYFTSGFFPSLFSGVFFLIARNLKSNLDQFNSIAFAIEWEKGEKKKIFFFDWFSPFKMLSETFEIHSV